jgi:hypothetical protein
MVLGPRFSTSCTESLFETHQCWLYTWGGG